MQLDDDELAFQFPKFSLRPVAEIDEILAEHAAAPERRTGQRALADEVTAIVHGAEAAKAAAEAADVLFGGDPLTASLEALQTLAGEVPSSRVSWPDDVVELLVTTGLVTSKSDARRQLEQGAVRANGEALGIDDDLRALDLLHGRYLLLRRGKRSYHLVEIFPNEVDGPSGRR
jgi:tyrosyl-tRNA synthetase